MPRSRREVANHVQTFGRCAQVFVGKCISIGDLEVRTRHFNDDDADLLLASGNFGSSKVTGSDVVVIPEAQMDHLAAREELPHLWRENTEVRPRIGCGFRPGVSSQNMEDAGAEFTVLVL